MTAIHKGNPLKRTTLVSLIRQGLTERVPLKRTHLYAGDAGFCHRKSTLIINCPSDLTDQVEAAGAMYMGIGIAIHDLIQRALERAGVLLGKEIRVTLDHVELSGYIDIVARVNDKPTIIEIKTCGSLPSRPKGWHHEQAMIYSLVSGLPDPIILYVSRSIASYDGRLLMQPITIDATRDDYVEIARRLYLAYEYSQLGKLGPMPEHITSERDCGFCQFKPICWGSTPSFLEHASISERAEISERAAAKAVTLVETMDERRASFLSRLTEVVR